MVKPSHTHNGVSSSFVQTKNQSPFVVLDLLEERIRELAAFLPMPRDDELLAGFRSSSQRCHILPELGIQVID